MGLNINVNDTKRLGHYMGSWNLEIENSHTFVSYYVCGDILVTYTLYMNFIEFFLLKILISLYFLFFIFFNTRKGRNTNS